MEVLSATNATLQNKDQNRGVRGRASGRHDIPPMPSLFIVVDEFSELLTARPEFIDLFIQIGRIGRSIGVHLLLASQRLEESKLRGLDTFLSYRIALRTFSAAESRVVIGVPDAYELPSPPGNGYLKYDTTNMVRFKAAYVSGPWHATGATVEVDTDDDLGGVIGGLTKKSWTPPVLAFDALYVPVVLPPEPDPVQDLSPVAKVTVDAPAEPAAAPSDDEDDTLLGIAVSRLKGHGWPGAPGVAAAARRAAHDGRAARRPAGRGSGPRPHGARSPLPRHPLGTRCTHRPATGPAARPDVAGLLRRERQPRRRRRAPVRQVDGPARRDRRPGADPHPGRGRLLHPRLRRRLADEHARPAARRVRLRPPRRRPRPPHDRRDDQPAAGARADVRRDGHRQHRQLPPRPS